MATSFCQHDIKNRSHFAQNRSNFLARFRSQANTCSNSVPTASLAGVRTLCQQQNQGRCWHQKRSNSAPQCSNVRTKTLHCARLLAMRRGHEERRAAMRHKSCAARCVRRHKLLSPGAYFSRMKRPPAVCAKSSHSDFTDTV